MEQLIKDELLKRINKNLEEIQASKKALDKYIDFLSEFKKRIEENNMSGIEVVRFTGMVQELELSFLDTILERIKLWD